MKTKLLMAILGAAALLPTSLWAWSDGYDDWDYYDADYSYSYSYSPSVYTYGTTYYYPETTYTYGRDYYYPQTSYSYGRDFHYPEKNYTYGRDFHYNQANGPYGRDFHYAQASGPYGRDFYYPDSGTRSGGERRYHYRVGYRDGGSPYPFNFYRYGYDTRNGYTSSYAPDNHDHRGSWEAYLQRLNQQARKYAKQNANNTPVCGNWERANNACRTMRPTWKWQPWMAMYE